MADQQAGNEAACFLVPEQRTVRISVGALDRQDVSQVEQRGVMSRQALDQLRFKPRVLSGGKRQLPRIDGDKKGIDTSICIGGAIHVRRTDSKRSCHGMVLEGPATYAAIKASSPQLEADNMISRRSGQVHAACEAYVEHGDAAFAGRSSSSQRGW